MKTYGEFCAEVARKYGLGNGLVTGHKSGYWIEAAELYAQQYRSEYDDQRNRINSLLSAESDLKAENSRLLEEKAKLIEINDIKSKLIISFEEKPADSCKEYLLKKWESSHHKLEKALEFLTSPQ